MISLRPVASLLTASLLVVGGAAAAHEHVAELRAAQARFAAASASAVRVALAAEGTIERVETISASGQRELDASVGRVLDETARTDLASALSQTTQHLRDAARVARNLGEEIAGAQAATSPWWPGAVRGAAIDLENAHFAMDFVLTNDIARLAAAVTAVRAATDVWHAEQERLAAEAAAAAAAAAAAKAAAAEAASSGGGYYSEHTGIHYVYVGGWVDGYGDVQGAVDQGGQVAIDYRASLGMIDVAAHNTSDSTAAYLSVGDIVEFSGTMSGRYQVTGSMSVPYDSSASVLQQLGTPVTMQTCGSGSIIIVGLAPIG